MIDPEKEPGKKPDGDENKKNDIQSFLERLKKSAERLNESAEKMRNLANIQKDNTSKLNEMNEKIQNAMKHLEEVRRRLANARQNKLNEQNTNQPAKKDDVSLPHHHAPEPPKTIFISKNEIILNKINKRSLKEFTDFVEFLKFNRMSHITDEEMSSYNLNDLIERLLAL